MTDSHDVLLRHMKEKIEAIETLSHGLKELGKGIPVIEKNVSCILSFTQVLRFGVCDVADVADEEGGRHGRNKENSDRLP
ncbi:MAG: hypothetical protein P8Y00_10305 [Deltaproteobacteria bacterium]